MALPQLEKIAAAQGFKGEAGQIIAASMVGEDRESVRRVIVVGLGAEDELCLEGVRKALGSGLKEAEKLKVEVLTAAPPGCGNGCPLQMWLGPWRKRQRSAAIVSIAIFPRKRSGPESAPIRLYTGTRSRCAARPQSGAGTGPGHQFGP